MTEPIEAAGVTALAYRLIANALRYRTSAPRDTKALADLAHDRDLLPKVTSQIRRLLEGFHRDTNVTYDIQGLQDHGVDVVARITTANAAIYVGLQVKSHKEIMENDPTATLIQQYHRARNHYNEDLRYYILLFGDATDRTVASRVRNVGNAFAKEAHVTVIDPVYAVTFLGLTYNQMDSLVTLTMRSGDPVIAQARAELAGNTPVTAALILRLLTSSLDPDTAAPITLDVLEQDLWISSVAYSADNLDVLLDSLGIKALPVRPPRDGNEAGSQREDFPVEYMNLYELEPRELAAALNAPEDQSLKDHHRVRPFLAEAIDDLEDDTGAQVIDNCVVLNNAHYSALLALAAEGQIKHDKFGTELIGYLIDTVLLSPS